MPQPAPVIAASRPRYERSALASFTSTSPSVAAALRAASLRQLSPEAFTDAVARSWRRARGGHHGACGAEAVLEGRRRRRRPEDRRTGFLCGRSRWLIERPSQPPLETRRWSPSPAEPVDQTAISKSRGDGRRRRDRRREPGGRRTSMRRVWGAQRGDRGGGGQARLGRDELTRLVGILRLAFSEVRVGASREDAVAELDLISRRPGVLPARSPADPLDDARLDALADRLVEMVAGLGDPHTRLTLAAAGAVGALALPFRVDRDEAGALRCIAATSETWRDAAPPPGVRLTHWNGVAVERVVAELALRGCGGERAALHRLTRRTRAEGAPPREDWVCVTYRDAAGGVGEWRGAWTAGPAPAGTGAARGAAAAMRTPPGDAGSEPELRRRGSCAGFEPIARGAGWTLWRCSETPGWIVARLARIEDGGATGRLAATVRQLAAAAVVLDLRGNPGGGVASLEPLLDLFEGRAGDAAPAPRPAFQFRDTALLRRLLVARPGWRAWAEDGGQGHLAALPLDGESEPQSRRGSRSRQNGSAEGRRPRLAAILVDACTWSAAEILAAILRRHTGAPVVGPIVRTAGATANVWAHPTLQDLAPNWIESLDAAAESSALPRALACWARRLGGGEARELEPGRRWVIARRAAPPVLAEWECERHRQTARAARPGALVLFDRARPVWPHLPGRCGLQFGVRRAVLPDAGGWHPLGAVPVDLVVSQRDAADRAELWRWSVDQLAAEQTGKHPNALHSARRSRRADEGSRTQRPGRSMRPVPRRPTGASRPSSRETLR
ncbi:MAG: hypothetical protein DWQ30_12525 [Acidobacteria bacterium]|nr:MAG: hypothetical protein DWQ30_12525 [Acidobacteriota bacterium]